MDRQLARTSAKQVSTNPDVIAEIQEPVKFKAFFADCVLFDVDLQPLSVLLKVGEASLAHEANGHNSSGNADFGARGIEFLGSQAAEPFKDLRNGMGEIECCRIRGLTQGFDLLQLLPA